jgi:hypothetical protein
MNKGFIKATAIYIFSIAAVFYLIWLMLDIALPDAHVNMVRALATAFNIQLPDNFFGKNMDFKVILILIVISLLSVGLIILNVYFGAVVTTDLIRPRVALITSKRGVLSVKWNHASPYMLVRMSNFHKADLIDVKLTVVLTVEETRDNNGAEEQFMSYLPIKEFTPPHILVMAQRLPWTIAVPADTLLNTSMVKDYHFKPGQPIEKSFSAGKKLLSAKRTLEIMIQGTDTKSYSNFAIHRKIPIDEQKGGEYTLHLHRGAFKSLPLQIPHASELEQYVD